MVAMIEQLGVEPGHRVLEIGAGTGYNAAILATLVGPEGGVTTLDLDEDISAEAAANLARGAVKNVRVLTGDGWLGAPGAAPFDRIEATASVWDLSPHWYAQMAEGGVLVVPLILRAGLQALIAFRKEGQGFRSHSVRPGGFMRLRGPHGGPEVSAPVNGWRYISDEMTPERARILGTVLRGEPRAEIVPVPPRGWFARVALEDPCALWMTHTEDWYGHREGIFIAERESLAVFEWRYGGPEEPQLLAFGDDSALLRLREWLRPGAPLEVRHLKVDAIPAGREIDTGGALVLRRPSFDVLIRYPSGSMI
jgi:protein-L-isoaspartate O-methyltransferase